MATTTVATRHVHVLLKGAVSDSDFIPVPNSLPRTRIAEPRLISNSLWNGRWLQASPYEEDCHLTDLEPLDLQSQLLALALISLEARTEEYAATAYKDALDWARVKQKLQSLTYGAQIRWKKQQFYVVEFRSVLKEHIDSPLLYWLDKESHREAATSGGLLKYWYGSPNNKRRNLATCLWRNKDDAFKGSQGPLHQQARSVIPQMYEQIDVKGFYLTVGDGISDWEFTTTSL